MVARKPILESAQAASSDATKSSVPNDPWADESNENVWGDAAPQSPIGAEGVSKRDVPSALRPGGVLTSEEQEENAWNEAKKQPSGADNLGEVPDALKPGADRPATNPFLRKQVPPPQEAPSAEALSKLNLNDESSNPWQSAIDAQKATPPSHPQPMLSDEVAKDPWAEQPSQPPQLAPPSPVLVSIPSEPEPPAWDEPFDKNEKASAPPLNPASEELTEEQHVWDDIGGLEKGKGKAKEPAPQVTDSDDWNLIDADAPSLPPKEAQAEASSEITEGKPPLPPRNNAIQDDAAKTSWRPLRQVVDGKTETYQVKNIQWHDTTTDKNPRTSPILVQNANGPCPLVALVNALTLTTPADIPDTALVQVLRSREQVSLNLLLDAVFDELMSPRRTSSEDSLPDVSDLYAFLQSLHTGMNVNPRFVPTPEIVTAYKRTSLTHLHPTERGDLIPGTFENTMEMSLYATFSIPLIHGWLPPKSDHVYAALERQAASYEDAQNLLFREEELEDKLTNSEMGLTEEEQQLYQDVLTIKSFLATSATQLTAWGIEVIGKAIRPGTFAILFRNDHFSTLYCHPQTMQLLTLVTDAGYKSHEDIVWETLVDVNGERAEFLSGDFTVLGSGGSVASSSGNQASDHGGEWTTVHGERGTSKHREEQQPMSPSTEQEDRDLALALQLQEEEEERHREEEARRRRESILSEQYIEQQGRTAGPNGRGGRGGAQGVLAAARNSANSLAPARSSSSNADSLAADADPRRPQTQQVRPLIPPRRAGVNRPADEGADDAPPSYEQAAHDVAYQPPVGHPTHPSSSPAVSRQSTRTSVNGLAGAPRPMVYPGNNRRPPVPPGAVLGNPQPKERDCIVM